MRSFLLFALLPLLVCQTPAAVAGTLYKCVDASGNLTFSDQPCDGKSRVSKTIETVSEDPEIAKARANSAAQNMKETENGYKYRRAQRENNWEEIRRQDDQKYRDRLNAESAQRAEIYRQSEAKARKAANAKKNCGSWGTSPCK